MNNVLDLSVIIVNYNVRDLLRDCLKSVYAQTIGISSEVFVVDNASLDGSADMVAKEFPQVQLIRNTENLRFSKANNIALKKSNSKYIFFLNPDTFILEDTVRKMIVFMKENYDAGAVGPMLLNPDGTFQRSAFSYFPSFRNAFFCIYLISRVIRRLNLIFNPRIKDPFAENTFLNDSTKETKWVSGSSFMVKKEVMNKIGFFDERLFLFSEDTDLCLRIRKAGWKVYFLESAKVIHYGGKSSAAINTASLCSIQSTYQFFKTHRGIIYALCFKILLPIDRLIALFLILLYNLREFDCAEIKTTMINSWRNFELSLILFISSQPPQIRCNKDFRDVK